MKIWVADGQYMFPKDEEPSPLKGDFEVIEKKEYDKLQALVKQIDLTLRVPAAEYVPAIRDVFNLIDTFNKEKTPWASSN